MMVEHDWCWHIRGCVWDYMKPVNWCDQKNAEKTHVWKLDRQAGRRDNCFHECETFFHTDPEMVNTSDQRKNTAEEIGSV